MCIDDLRGGLERYGDLEALANSKFATCEIVEQCMRGEGWRGVAAQGVLMAGLQQLRQKRIQWYQQSHAVLIWRYVHGLKNTEAATIAEITVRNIRKRTRQALQRLQKVLGETYPLGRELAIALCYGELEKETQETLRGMVVLAGYVTNDTFAEEEITTLGALGFVGVEGGVIGEIAEIVSAWVSEGERLVWWKFSAESTPTLHAFLQTKNTPQIVAHFIQNEAPQETLQQAATYLERDDTWRRAPEWARVALGLGRISAEIPTSIAYFQEIVLGCDSLSLKAAAYYELGRRYRSVDMRQVLPYYQKCRDCLQQLTPPNRQPTLLAETLINEAFILCEQRTDLHNAYAKLEAAQPLLSDTDFDIQSDWYNAMARLLLLQGKVVESADYQQQAYHFAQDNDRRINTSHNLGTIHFYLGNYANAREFYRESQQIAIASKVVDMQIKNSKGLGYCAFGEGDYVQAIVFYTECYHHFQATGQDVWLGSSCYDLAEALSLNDQQEQAKTYWREGVQIATSLGEKSLLKTFYQLALEQQTFAHQLTSYQRQGIIELFVQTHGAIRNKQCQALFEVGRKSAENDLRTLCQKQILQRVGQGRATHYIKAIKWQGG